MFESPEPKPRFASSSLASALIAFFDAIFLNRFAVELNAPSLTVGFLTRAYRCFLKKVAIFHASIAFHGNSAVV